MHKLDRQKVIFLFTPGPMGGAEKVVANGFKALIQKGIQASMWVIQEERATQVSEDFLCLLRSLKVEFRVFSSRGIFDYLLLKQLISAFKEEKATLIHAHGFKAAFYGHLARVKPSRFLITHHGRTGHTWKVKIYEYIELQIMKRASGVVAVSGDMKNMLIREGVESKKIQVVENLLTSTIESSAPLPKDKLRLLFVGRLSPEKGCSIFLESLKFLPENHFEVSVVGDGVLRTELEEKFPHANVVFLGFRSNVLEIMNQHHVLVLPSFREGQPLTLIEACCLGIPVVASEVGGIPELITHEYNGLLFEAGDSQKLAEVLKDLDKKFDVLKLNAELMQENFKERFSPENWADRSIQVYQIVLNQL